MAELPFIAFVDETLRDSPLYPKFYVLTAAIVDRSKPEYAALQKVMHRVARTQPTGMIHASEMARAQNSQEGLVSVEREIGENAAVRALAVVHSPFGAGGEEEARQRCVAELMVTLSSAFDVSSVTMDSRDPLGISSKSTIPRRGTRNFKDLATVRGLQAIGELPEDLAVSHANDRLINGLWIADVASYAVGSSLARRDPSRLQWIAPHLYMREARILPVSERKDTHQTTAPVTDLSFYLNAFVEQAKAIHDRASGLFEDEEEPEEDLATGAY